MPAGVGLLYEATMSFSTAICTFIRDRQWYKKKQFHSFGIKICKFYWLGICTNKIYLYVINI